MLSTPRAGRVGADHLYGLVAAQHGVGLSGRATAGARSPRTGSAHGSSTRCRSATSSAGGCSTWTRRDRRLLYLWYLRQLPAHEIARELRISRRQCFRRRATAIRAIVEARRSSVRPRRPA